MPLPLSNFFFRRRRQHRQNPSPPAASPQPPSPPRHRHPPTLLVGKSTRRRPGPGNNGSAASTHVQVLRQGWAISVHPHFAHNLLLEHLSSQASSSPASAAAAVAAAVGNMPSFLSIRRHSRSSKRKQQQMYEALSDDAVEDETQILTPATHHVAMQPIYIKFLLVGMQRVLAEAHSPLAWHDRRRASFDWQHGDKEMTTADERILKLVISEKAARMQASELALVVEAWRHGVQNKKGGEEDVLLARGEIDNVCEHLYQGREGRESNSSSSSNDKEQEGMLVLPLAYVGSQEDGHKSFRRRRNSKQKDQAEVGFSLTYLPPSRPRHCQFPVENEGTVINGWETIQGGAQGEGEGEEHKEEVLEEEGQATDGHAGEGAVVFPRHSIEGFLQAEDETRMAGVTHTHTVTARVSPEVAVAHDLAARLMDSLRVEEEEEEEEEKHQEHEEEEEEEEAVSLVQHEHEHPQQEEEELEEETAASDEIEREEEEEEEKLSSPSPSHRGGRPSLYLPPKASPQPKHSNNNDIHTWKARSQHRRQQVARVRGLLDELERLPRSLEEIDSNTSFPGEELRNEEEEEGEEEEGQYFGHESRMTQKLVELILQERNQRMASMR